MYRYWLDRGAPWCTVHQNLGVSELHCGFSSKRRRKLADTFLVIFSKIRLMWKWRKCWQFHWILTDCMLWFSDDWILHADNSHAEISSDVLIADRYIRILFQTALKPPAICDNFWIPLTCFLWIKNLLFAMTAYILMTTKKVDGGVSNSFLHRETELHSLWPSKLGLFAEGIISYFLLCTRERLASVFSHFASATLRNE